MKKKLQIDWIHHGIELIVVFISISLAFVAGSFTLLNQNTRYYRNLREIALELKAQLDNRDTK